VVERLVGDAQARVGAHVAVGVDVRAADRGGASDAVEVRREHGVGERAGVGVVDGEGDGGALPMAVKMEDMVAGASRMARGVATGQARRRASVGRRADAGWRE
jgi:hypothetical protein